MRILIVDDDEMVRQVCEGMLHALDHLSMVVSDATAAIQYLTESSQHFDCIILDQGLLGMGGIELLSILRERKIAIPVILISGGPLLTVANDAAAEWSQFQFLPKPFTLSDLRSAIEQCLS